MKLSRKDLEQLNARLVEENEPLTLALGDVCAGNVKWFCNSRTYSLGISRPTSATGGIAIVREAGITQAYYWERYSRETLAHLANLMTSGDTEANREFARRRSVIEQAQAYVSEMQRATRFSR